MNEISDEARGRPEPRQPQQHRASENVVPFGIPRRRSRQVHRALTFWQNPRVTVIDGID